MIRVLVIMGPTAGGKSELALALAAASGREIISADSRQIYRGLVIGTAQPSAAERARVPHHLVDCLPLTQRYSAQRFADDALDLIRARRQAPPLVVGGTGFYLRSLWAGLVPLDAPAEALAAERAALADLPSEKLAALLAKEDPESAGRLDPHDRQRMIRALEVKRATGVALPEHQRRGRRAPTDIAWTRVLITRPRAALHARIAQRTQAMFAAGWVEEVASLLSAGADPLSPGMQTLGYPEIVEHLRGGLGLDAAQARIIERTRQFAKRQETWFAKEQREHVLDPAADDCAHRLSDYLPG